MFFTLSFQNTDSSKHSYEIIFVYPIKSASRERLSKIPPTLLFHLINSHEKGNIDDAFDFIERKLQPIFLFAFLCRVNRQQSSCKSTFPYISCEYHSSFTVDTYSLVHFFSVSSTISVSIAMQTNVYVFSFVNAVLIEADENEMVTYHSFCDPWKNKGECSDNFKCRCSTIVPTGERICALQIKCSSALPCDSNHRCNKTDSICVLNRHCSHRRLCYPISLTSPDICPPLATADLINTER